MSTEDNKKQHKNKPENGEPKNAQNESNKKASKVVDALEENKVVKQPWTEARCLKAAKRFLTEEEWKTGAPSSYKAAVSHGWVAACVQHMSNVTKLSKPKKNSGFAGKKYSQSA